MRSIARNTKLVTPPAPRPSVTETLGLDAIATRAVEGVVASIKATATVRRLVAAIAQDCDLVEAGPIVRTTIVERDKAKAIDRTVQHESRIDLQGIADRTESAFRELAGMKLAPLEWAQVCDLEMRYGRAMAPYANPQSRSLLMARAEKARSAMLAQGLTDLLW